MTGLYVEARPFPGHVPAPAPDPSKAAASALAHARRVLTEPATCPPECPICNSGWECFVLAIGACEVCGEPCRSTDPEGRRRHPPLTCGGPA